MAASQLKGIKTKHSKGNKLPKPNASPAFSACLECSTNTKSECSCPIGTSGICALVVLLLLLKHRFIKHMYAVLGPYTSKLKL